MGYTPTDWKKRIVDTPDKYTLVDLGGGLFTITPSEGNVTQEGTPLTEANLNHLETQYDEAGTDLTAHKTNATPPGVHRWTAGKLLKGAGADADPMEIAVPDASGNAILEKLQKHLGVWWFNNHWLPAGMVYNAISGSGAFTWSDERLELATGITANSYAYIHKRAWGLSQGSDWGKKRYLGVQVYIVTYSAQNIHLVSGYCPVTGSANVGRHMGFKVINDSLYGTVADSTTESTLLLETLSAAVYRRLECVLTPGVECRFYVDGVDKGALTTNLPTTINYADYILEMSIENTETVTKSIRLFESRIFQEE